MRAWLQNLLSAALFASVTGFAFVRAGEAQLISLKTVPVPTGEQFLVYPSAMIGMGSFITVEDPLVDPFSNPAKGARLAGATVFAVPTFYSVSDDGGGGRTLSTGALVGGARYFGGAVLALQQLDGQLQNGWVPPGILEGGNLVGGAPNNRYFHGTAGMKLPGTRVALGAAVFRASLEAMDGVSWLYAGSSRIVQEGGVTDLRAGMLAELSSGGWLEAVVVHDRVDMQHDVTYLDALWDPGSQTTTFRPRLEHNLNRTRTTGLHLGFVQPLKEEGWRAGGVFTFNRKLHPKIPNYQVIGVTPIPRDPGNSTAVDIGVGVSRRSGPSLFAMDLVYQPARSHTWAQAETPVQAANGVVIPPLGKTVENWFDFQNVRFNVGIGREGGVFEWQLGLGLIAYDYSLDQTNHVLQASRSAEGSWMEWVPSWGAVFRLSGFDIRYSGRLTLKGFPDLVVEQSAIVVPEAPGDILVAPTGPVDLGDYATFTNQFSVTLPIGRRAATRTN